MRHTPEHESELKTEGHLPASCELRPREIPQQSGRTRSSVHQTLDEARDGLFLLRDGVANLTRLRDDEHDQERTPARGGKRRCEKPDGIGCQAVWDSNLRKIERTIHALFVFSIFFATEPSHVEHCVADLIYLYYAALV